jgi:hypothetical protein
MCYDSCDSRDYLALVVASMSTPLLSDSTCAISIACDLIKYEFTKHIGVDAYHTRSQI